MPGPIERRSGLVVDMHRIVHGKAEIAAFGDMREVRSQAGAKTGMRER